MTAMCDTSPQLTCDRALNSNDTFHMMVKSISDIDMIMITGNKN